MPKIWNSLALSFALASVVGIFGVVASAAATGAGPRAPDHYSTQLHYRSPQSAGTGDTSLYHIFRDGRYDTPACFMEHPLPETCRIGAARHN